MLPTMGGSSPDGNLVGNLKWGRTTHQFTLLFFPLSKMNLQLRETVRQNSSEFRKSSASSKISSILNIINVSSADFRTFWKMLFHHQIQPAVMCPVSCTQLYKNCVPLVPTVCLCQSQDKLCVRSLHYNIIDECLWWIDDISWSFSCLLKQGPRTFTESFEEPSGPWFTQIPATLTGCLTWQIL